MNCRNVLLRRHSSSSQKSPFTVTSITRSSVSLQVAQWTTCVTPCMAWRTTARSLMLPVTTSTRACGSELPIVTQRADDGALVSRLVQNSADEIAAYLACRACHQDVAHLHPFRSETKSRHCVGALPNLRNSVRLFAPGLHFHQGAPFGWVSGNHVRDPHPLYAPRGK